MVAPPTARLPTAKESSASCMDPLSDAVSAVACAEPSVPRGPVADGGLIALVVPKPEPEYWAERSSISTGLWVSRIELTWSTWSLETLTVTTDDPLSMLRS